MANQRINDLSESTSPATTVNIPHDSADGTKRTTLANFETKIAADFVAAPTTFKIAPLDGTNKVPGTYLPASAMAFKGGVAGASVPATSTAAGDYYVITSAGTSQSITWAVGDGAVYNGSSGSWTKHTGAVKAITEGGTGSTTAAAARTALGLISDDATRGLLEGRLPRPGLWCDVTQSTRMTGTAAVNFGTGDFTIAAVIQMDDYTPSSSSNIWDSHSAGNNKVRLQLHTAGTIRLVFTDNGGVTATYTLTPDVAFVDGETYHIAITCDRDGNATLYVNGISDRDASGAGVTTSIAASSAIDIGSGNANPWAGLALFGGVIHSFSAFNRLLSASEVLLIAQRGRVLFADQWGSFTALYSSDFSAGADSFSVGAGVTVDGNIDSITDGTTSKNDCLRLTSDTSNGLHYATRTTLTTGKRYRVAFEYYIPSSQTASRLRIGGGSVSATGNYVEVSTAGTWQSTSVEFVALGTGLWIGMANTSTHSFTGVASEVAYVRAVVVTPIGAVLNPDFAGANPELSLTVVDQSSNANHGTANASGIYQVRKNGQVNTEVLTVGSSARLKKLLTATSNLNFASIAAAGTASLTITVTGAAVGDSVALGLPAAPDAGIVFNAYVSATDTVTVRASNLTAGAIDPASATYRVTVFNF